ncbi:efflux RND transporter periplasmic adaptor subunit [Schlesneria sp. T3-172]|uniref:efflux RND transporter periplasmic adaptor subunit n=1 Tax=Schlesneria sphaerica TaxID=3373610 RepID=UPI0037CBCEDB
MSDELAHKKGADPKPETLFQKVWGGARYIGTLLILLAVAYYGHSTHWSFGYGAHAAPHSEHEETEVREKLETKEDAEEWQVSFPSEKSLQQSGIKTVPIEQRTVTEKVKTTGVITYDERMFAALSSRVSGTVWRVLKQPGDTIRKGDVLVVIDAVEVGRAKAEFFSDLVDVESKAEILAALEKASASVPERQIREARVNLREAKIRLQDTEQTLINMGFALKKEDFEGLKDAERSAKLHFLGLPDSIAKSLDPSQTTTNLLPLTAAFDGTLLHHDLAIGEMVEIGKSLLEIADMRRMWLKLDVPKEDANRLVLGQVVHFLPDGLDQDLDSKITWIDTEMNQKTRTLRIRAEVDNPIVSSDPETGNEVRLLRAQTFGIGTIVIRESAEAFVVPRSAILHADAQPMIFAKTDALTFVAIEVKLGPQVGDLVQIESDELRPDLEVVCQGTHILKSEWILNHVASTP